MDFSSDKIKVFLNELKKSMTVKQTEIKGFVYKECDYENLENLPKVDSSWKTFEEKDLWGGAPCRHFWFYNKFKTENETVFKLRTGMYGEGWGPGNPQFIIFLNGKMVYGMDYFHPDIIIDANTEYEMYIYAYTNDSTKMLEFNGFIAEINPLAEKLYYDIKVPFDVCEYLDEDDKNRINIMNYLKNTVNIIDLRIPGSRDFNASLKKADAYISREFYGEYCDSSEVSVIGIGHSHIDIAWLWTVQQTREKVLRTFSTVVSLMKYYPEYKFISSQAQLYEFVKEDAPQLYEEIKKLVAQGRWEIEGAMWVEADCNLSGGESLVRQILFGKRFFKSEFDKDCKVLWLPDVFGYCAALPQILQKSGVNKFVTSKISWNEGNTMPHDTFMWQGIDGTEILTYFLTGQDKKRGEKPVRYADYTGKVTAAQLAGTWERYQDKNISNEVLLPYGYGDGGGGSTAWMLEMGRRLEKGINGCPKFKFDTVTSFLDGLLKTTEKHKNVPKWVGELYLEYHRGTYTSMAKNKSNNRKCEFLYHNAELLSEMAGMLCGAEYPQDTINEGWKKILLNQFHDIIPGSSIKEVYDVSDREYSEVKVAGEAIVDGKCQAIARNIGSEGGLLVFNNTPFTQSGTVFVDGQAVYVEDIPANGYKVTNSVESKNKIKLSKNIMENAFFKVRFKDGDIVSIYDKKNCREVIKKGEKANELLAFEDFPKDWDAWEITNYYTEKMWKIDDVTAFEQIDYGEKAGFKVTKKFLNSEIVQEICLYANTPKIDFDTYINWKEAHILLKAAFPIDVHCDKATFDIQFGNVERPTHRNTSWDEAKFEVCAHKFADVAEDGYGVSLMNDCKYGYDVLGSTMRLTLLKSATYPNPDADKCEHRFTYSLYPHSGDFRQANTYAYAYALNNPLTALEIGAGKGELPSEFSFVGADCENIIIETVKKAEDSGEIIVRLYDSFKRRSTPKITFGFDVESAFVCDMMENKTEELEVKDNTVVLEVKPFEIVTLRVKRREVQ
ncbi:MAG: alpha-mannosidase [Ruminococcaceae bacterium]|nr:alpha-mannosidase [Oscillospiraceae bacterium]